MFLAKKKLRSVIIVLQLMTFLILLRCEAATRQQKSKKRGRFRPVRKSVSLIEWDGYF